MVDTIYVEQAVINNERVQLLLSRYPKASFIEIDKYTEVFNSHAQNFRIQKNNPSLVVAAKHNQRVFSTPSSYETGGGANYYFSHMLNCLYDCRYCFLQGMYRSANFLLFVNYEDFVVDIQDIAVKHQNDQKPPWFFSGYDCDSLAFEPVTGFADYFLTAFSKLEYAVLELRTKSTQIRQLLERPPLKNVVVAYSLSPSEVAQSVEIGAPSFNKRVQALKKLQSAGWRVGVRFDPIIWQQDYQQHYRSAFETVFQELDMGKVDSVTVGGFRLPKGYYKTMRKLHPEHWIFHAGLSEQDGLVSYRQEIEQEVFAFAKQQLSAHVDCSKLYFYPTKADNPEANNLI